MNQEPYCDSIAALYDAISTLTTPASQIFGGTRWDTKTRFYLAIKNGLTWTNVETTSDLYHVLFDDDGFVPTPTPNGKFTSLYRKDAALLVLRPLLRTQKLTAIGI